MNNGSKHVESERTSEMQPQNDSSEVQRKIKDFREKIGQALMDNLNRHALARSERDEHLISMKGES
jgi:hypothetical protein